ncbi:hypothetical protein ACFYRY_30710 [Streptomyces sp. NPDC005263]|uniref:hypothetical protein n=1 Tax=Streptomyces sp. NPDC005263 TaxID=3364711 RepID=UPI00368BAD7F
MDDTEWRSGPQWGPWSLDEHGYPGLAQYANAEIAELIRLRLWFQDTFEQRNRNPRDLLGNLYEALRARRIFYEVQPWHAGPEQIVRDSGLVDRGCATCLDISLLFASMCLHAGLRPYLAILKRAGDEHAVLLVDLAAGTGRDGVDPPVRCMDAPTLPRHVYKRAPVGASLLRDAVAVDVTVACRTEGNHSGGGFAEACAEGRSQLLSDDYRDCVLIDVVALQADGWPPFAPVPVGERPVISRRLPSRPPFVSYASRANVMERLTGAVGTVVLLGEPGSGKSMLAHEIAARAQYGSGWFLDAHDRRVLETSLGRAEIAETGVDPAAAEAVTTGDHAQLALARLREAPGSWVVVLDNVEVSPEELRGWPEPSADKGQLLLITTTNRAWARRAGMQCVELSALSDQDVTEQLDADAPSALLAGRPLLVAASRRFREETGADWWARGCVDHAPTAFWTAVRRAVEEAGGAEGRAAWYVAQALAWLPSVDLDADLVRGVAAALMETDGADRPGDGTTRRAAERLHRLGLVDLRDGRITLHGLFRDAVRADVRRHGPQTAAQVAKAVVEDLFARLDTVGRHIQYADGQGRVDVDPTTQAVAVPHALALSREDVDVMAELLRARDDTRALHALGGLVERHDHTMAAGLYDAVLDRTGEWTSAHERPVSPAFRLIIVNCLRGKARAVFRTRDSTVEQLEEAMDWMVYCRRLCADPPDVPALREAFLLTSARAEALYGLLLRRRALQHRDTGRRRSLLQEAKRILLASARQRLDIIGERTDSPDVDRSRFNLAGLEIELAKASEPHQRSACLDEAWKVYTEVLAIREARYRTRHLEEVVTCINGFAIVLYYRATLLPASTQQRSDWLRQAADHAHDAMRLRQEVEGRTDGPNTVKSAALVAKIALARLDLRAAATGRASDRSDTLFGQYRTERDTGTLLPAAPHPRTEADAEAEADAQAEAATRPLSHAASPPVPEATPQPLPEAAPHLLTDKANPMPSSSKPSTPSSPLPSFPPVPLPTVQNVSAGIEAWIGSEAMRTLVTAFDGDDKFLLDPSVPLTERVTRLHAFSARWEDRPEGQERNDGFELDMTAQARDIVLAATGALGLHGCPPPRHRDYDHVLLLGGLVRACFNRPAFAAELLSSGTVHTGSVVALGAHRPFKKSEKNPSEDEFLLARKIGHPHLTEEYEALDLGTRLAFDLQSPEHVEGERHDDIGGTWGVHHYRRPDGLAIRVAAAPSSDPAVRRAHTGDTYAFFAERLEQLPRGARLLIVTTPIYAPSQHFTALHRLGLPYGVHVETVGGDPARVEGALHQPFTPTRYLAEVRGALRALVGLSAAATEAPQEA